MATVVPINENVSQVQAQRRRKTTETVATGVGVTGYATRYASKRGILGSMLGRTNQTMHIANSEIKQATTLFGKFSANAKYFTQKIIKFFSNYENSRIIGPIVKNPIVQKCAGGFGTIMAFFVLVTGVRKAIESGSSAISNAKHRYDYFAA